MRRRRKLNASNPQPVSREVVGSGTALGPATVTPEVLPWVRPPTVAWEVAEKAPAEAVLFDEVYPKAPAPPPSIVSLAATIGEEPVKMNVKLYSPPESGGA